MRGFALLALLLGCTPASAKFLPPGAISENPESQRFYEEWFGENLRALRERPLVVDEKTHVVRVLILPTFSPPRSYRVVIDHRGKGVLHYRRASGMGGYDPGEIEAFRVALLSRGQVARLVAWIDQRGIWASGPDISQVQQFDGTHVVIEISRGGHYHVVHSHYTSELGGLIDQLWRYSRYRG